MEFLHTNHVTRDSTYQLHLNQEDCVVSFRSKSAPLSAPGQMMLTLQQAGNPKLSGFGV